MHPENLLPLARLLPLFVLMAVCLGSYLWFERRRRKRDKRRMIQREKNYWMAEKAYRARMRMEEWLGGTKTPRLPYQGPPLGSGAGPKKSLRRK